MESLGEIIKKYRAQKKLSVRQLAGLIFIDIKLRGNERTGLACPPMRSDMQKKISLPIVP